MYVCTELQNVCVVSKLMSVCVVVVFNHMPEVWQGQYLCTGFRFKVIRRS